MISSKKVFIFNHIKVYVKLKPFVLKFDAQNIMEILESFDSIINPGSLNPQSLEVVFEGYFGSPVFDIKTYPLLQNR